MTRPFLCTIPFSSNPFPIPNYKSRHLEISEKYLMRRFLGPCDDSLVVGEEKEQHEDVKEQDVQRPLQKVVHCY